MRQHPTKPRKRELSNEWNEARLALARQLSGYRPTQGLTECNTTVSRARVARWLVQTNQHSVSFGLHFRLSSVQNKWVWSGSHTPNPRISHSCYGSHAGYAIAVQINTKQWEMTGSNDLIFKKSCTRGPTIFVHKIQLITKTELRADTVNRSFHSVVRNGSVYQIQLVLQWQWHHIISISTRLYGLFNQAELAYQIICVANSELLLN